MRKHFYRKDQNQIIFHDTLEIIDMNETAGFIYESRKETSKTETITSYAEQFQISKSEAEEEVSELLEQFKELGISFQTEELKLGSFAPHTPIVHIIQNCNSPCVMCDCWQTKTKNYHPANKLKEFHKKMKELGARGIMISGGEPLLHPEIKTILRDLKEMGLPIFLNTNGILLGKHLAWLSQLEIEELVISMDGSDADTYRIIRGTPMFDKVWKNIKDFRQQNPKTRLILRTTLTKHNAFNLDELVSLAKENGVDHIGFSPLDISSESFSRVGMEQGRAERLTDLLLPTSAQIDSFLSAFFPGNRYHDMIEVLEAEGFLSWSAGKFKNCLEFYKSILIDEEKSFSADPCLFPIFSMVVDYNGDLKNCFYSKPFGNLYELEKTEWSFEKQMKSMTESKKCETCRGKVFCDLGLMQEAGNA